MSAQEREWYGGSTGHVMTQVSEDRWEPREPTGGAPTFGSESPNTVLAGPTTGAPAIPTFRALVSADLPTVPVTKGGTGATDAATALSNLGAAASSHTHGAADVTSGTLDAARIPSLDASKITSGTLDRARLGSGTTGGSSKFLREDSTWDVPAGGGTITEVGSSSWTPTGSWTTNVAYTGKWRRVGDVIEAWVNIALTGQPDNVSLTITLPGGLSYDTAKLPDADLSPVTVLGEGQILDAGTARRGGVYVFPAGAATAVAVYAMTTAPTIAAVNRTSPVTWASGDEISVHFRVPISGWTA